MYTSVSNDYNTSTQGAGAGGGEHPVTQAIREAAEAAGGRRVRAAGDAVDTVGRSVDVVRAMPFESVDVKRAAELEAIGGDVLERARAGGLLTLDEIGAGGVVRLVEAAPAVVDEAGNVVIPARMSREVVKRRVRMEVRSQVRRGVGVFKRGPRRGQIKWRTVERSRFGVHRTGAGPDQVCADWADDQACAFDTAAECAAWSVERATVGAWSRLLDPGVWMLTLAGGAAFVDGGAVRLTGGGMAARAARRVFALRGKIPSDTSLDDAAATAAADLVVAWDMVRQWWADCWPMAWDGGRDERGLWLHSIRYLAAVAWRAAYRSLTSDAAEGFTGRKAGQMVARLPLALAAERREGQAASELDLASLKAWAAAGGRAVASAGGREWSSRPGWDDERQAKRRAVAWLADTLGVRPGPWLRALSRPVLSRRALRDDGKAAERARVCLLVWLLLGATWDRAARAAGYIDGTTAADALRKSGAWAVLRAAATGQRTERERELQAAWWHAARSYVVAKRKARRLSIHAAGAGVSGYVERTTRTYRNATPTGAQRSRRLDESQRSQRREPLRVATVATVAPVRIVNPLADDWRRAVEAVTLARARVSHLARLLARARVQRADDWAKVATGLRSHR